MGLGGVFLLEMDTFMLGIMGTNEQLSVYSIAKTWTSKASHVNNVLITGVMTTFSVITNENIKEKRDKFKKVSICNFIITFGVMLFLLFAAPYVLIIMYGEEYSAAAQTVKILAFYYGLYGISTFYASFLDFQKKAKKRSKYYCSIIIINFVLNCCLIPIYGVNGAAIATVISLIPYTVFVYKESKNCFVIRQ